MKILAIICEFNPLHNGHAYLMERAKKESGCDALVCIMSGCFTQRGEICRNDKYTRAKHAVLCGADAVIELPVSFAVSPAEIFARGAVKTICTIPGVDTLCFGCEGGSEGDFREAARILNGESGAFRRELERNLGGGESYIRSYRAAFISCGGDGDFISSPNNILGIEYTKALAKAGKNIKILPILRKGAGYGDSELKDNFSSAGAIRANAENEAIAGNMPPYSHRDFTAAHDNGERFYRLAADWLYMCPKQNLTRIYGCTEGLENRLKCAASGADYNKVVNLCTSKRYTQSRIKRILAANLLGLYADETEDFLNSALPLRVLAVNAGTADAILPVLAAVNADNIPPEGAAAKCFALSTRAYGLWRHLSSPLLSDNPNEKMIIV